MKLIEEENKMKTFSYHLEAIIATFKTLIKGRFLVFFVPGLLISLMFFYLMYDSEPEVDDSSMLSSFFDVLKFRQLLNLSHQYGYG